MIPDDVYIRKAVAGDDAAFDASIKRHRPKVYAVAHRMLGNPRDAEGVTHATFLGARQHIKIFATLLMFSILMLCLAQNSPEEPGDTAMHFIARLHDRPVWRFAYALDGKTIVCGSENDRIAVYDTANGQEIARLRGHTDRLRSITYAPDGKTIACGSSDGSVYLYDAKTAKHITKIGGVRITRETTRISAAHQRIWGLAYSPDGRMLATGGADGSVYLYDTETWDAETAQRITQRKEHPVTVTTLRFSPDGKTLASESSDGTLYLWRISAQ